MTGAAETRLAGESTRRTTLGLVAQVAGLALILSVIAELIGTHEFKLGAGAIVLFPIIWVILLAGLVSIQRLVPLTQRRQEVSMELLTVGITIFLARLGTLIGPTVGQIVDAGPAILLQEVGHILGTVILVLPIAVLLGLGRASIGATFSIDREPQLGYMLEKYGPGSPEYSGTFAVWLLGSVFGALYVSLLAAFLTALGIFDPLALALGAGVGSSSMMAAAAAAIGAAHPGMQDQILVYAGLSNLVTNIVGLYAGYFVALPLAVRLYRFWSRVLRRSSTRPEPMHQPAVDTSYETRVKGPLLVGVAIVVMGALALVTNVVNTRGIPPADVLGIALLCAITGASFWLRSRIPGVPAVVWAISIGLLATASFVPFGSAVASTVDHLDFITVGVPALACVGLSLGRDVGMLKRLSWRVVIIALLTYTGTYVAAAALAELVL